MSMPPIPHMALADAPDLKSKLYSRRSYSEALRYPLAGQERLL